MTQQQFLEEIKQLSIAERITLIEAIFRSLREELETSGGNAAISGVETPEASIQEERERKMAAVRRLRGVLKTSGNPPSDEELKDDYTNYLIEKYS
jgi:vacuolar-type H+-ATPase subunit D/Vma8